MNEDRLSERFAALSDYDRYLARAQMARAEAIVEGFAAVAALVRKGWHRLADAARAYSDARTRQWPHEQALR
jgi:hypothetical protein